MQTSEQLPVAVLGAGPVGLAAAAHLIGRGLPVIVLEAAPVIAAHLEAYRHVHLFSPWQYNTDSAARALLAPSGWRAPAPDALPTAGELIDDYLAPLAALPAIAAALRLSHRVTQLSRLGMDKVKTAGRDAAPFVIRALAPTGEHELLARAVIDATGTWSQPNPLGANGLPALGEAQAASAIAFGMPDILGTQRARYAGKRVLVAGSGHSAAGNLIALATLAQQAPATRIVWVLRGDNPEKTYGGGEADQLAARGALGTQLRALQQAGRLEVHTHFRIGSIEADGHKLRVRAAARDGVVRTIEAVDEIIGATGARPELSLARELRLRLDPWLESTEALAPLIDPNLHSCGTVRPHGHRELSHPEQGYYVAGAKSYGRAPNFLLATGYEQVRSIAAALAGDMRAADQVQLSLPETGVCSTRAPGGKMDAAQQAGGCCGGPAPAGANACCVRDADAKAAGQGGCGCASESKKSGKSCGR
jgi:thioredoxin reductase